MRYTELEITEFSNVGYGKTATARIDAGPNMKEVVLNTTNIDTDQIKEIIVKVGSGTPYNLPGALVRAIQEHKAEVMDDDFWVIPFLDRSAITIDGQEKSSLQTLRGENVIVKVKIGARKTPAQDALEPEILGQTVTGEPVFTDPSKTTLYREFMPRAFELLIPIGKTGKNTFSDFDNQENHLLRRMFLQTTDITDIEIIKDDGERYKVSVAYMHYMQKRAGLIVPAGFTVFDPMYSGFNWADMLNVTGKFKMVFHTTTATDIVAYAETLKAVGETG